MAEHSTNDSFNKAMDLLIKERISNLKFDQTIECTIVDDSDKEAGHYTVNDGSINFDAYCESSEYKKDDSVYVTIPGGDFTQNKIIISKNTANQNSEPINFQSPLDEMFIITENLKDDIICGSYFDQNNRLVANGRSQRIAPEKFAPGELRPIWEYDFTKSSNASIRNNALFTRIGIKAKFKCDLGVSFNMISGHYGLLIQIFSTSISDSEKTNDGDQQTVMYLSTEDMFGNPYTFMAPISQSKVFNISQLNRITKMSIWFYQDNEFKCMEELSDGSMRESYIPNEMIFGGNTQEVYPNIFVDDLEVYFGIDLKDAEDNTFQLYSASSSTYNLDPNVLASNPDYNRKSIVPIWFNKTEDNQYLGFSDGVYELKEFKDAYGNGNAYQPIGRAYDENEYVLQARYINKGAQLNQADLINKNIPTVQELLQIYAYIQDIDKILREKIAPIVSTKIDKIINSAVSDFATQQTVLQQNATVYERAGYYQHNSNNNTTSLDAIKQSFETAIDESNENSWMAKGIETLQNYGKYYTGLINNVPIGKDEFNKLYILWTALKNNLNLIFSYATEFFTNTENNIRSAYYTFAQITPTSDVRYLKEESKIYWTTYNDKLKKLKTECFEYVDELEKILFQFTDNNTTYQNATGENIIEYCNRDTLLYQYQAIQTKFSNMARNGGMLSDLDINTTKENFTNSFAKRYCIYWYKYEPGYKNENENFVQANWKPIEGTMNYGLPLDNEYTKGEDQNKYWITRSTGAGSVVTIDVGREDALEEKIRAVLIYDHQIYYSNVLTYINEGTIVDTNNEDKTSGLWIATTDEEVSKDEFDDDGNPLVISKDTYNNKETYQLYDETNYLVNSAEGYKKRKLRARFTGVTGRGDSYLIGGTIYWYLPLHSTMLKVRHEDLINAGFEGIVDPDRNFEEMEAEIRNLHIDTTLDVSQLREIIHGYQNDNKLSDYVVIPEDFNLEQNDFQGDIVKENNWKQTARNIIFTVKEAEIRNNYNTGYYSVPPEDSPQNTNYQQGYLMATREIKADSENPDLVDIESTEFFYQIKDYFIPSFTNNTIKCRVVKDGLHVYNAEVSFTFASFGTNGTDYSLCIVPATNQAALTDAHNLQLKAELYDINGDLMKKETEAIEVSWEYNLGNSAWLTQTAPDITVNRVGDGQFGYSVLKATTNVNIISYSEAQSTETSPKINEVSGQTQEELDEEAQNNNGVPVDTSITVTTNRNPIKGDVNATSRTITLTAYYPVAWAAADYYIEGPSIVVYDSSGANPKYYNGPYKLFEGPSSQHAHEEVTGVIVEMSNPYFTTNQDQKVFTTLAREILPKIKEVGNVNGVTEYYLSVPSMFVSGNDAFVNVLFKKNNQILYVQPIRVIQNRFSSPMLNAWDGELTIDEKNGTILASMVGAGKKEDDNTFSGVLMGDVAEKTEDTGTGLGKQGLFGFNHGEQSFGFLNDGTGFIGKAKRGRIMFDGNSSKIQSMSYSTNQLGMMIDLDDGEIDMRGSYIDFSKQSPSWKAAAKKRVVKKVNGQISYDKYGNVEYEYINLSNGEDQNPADGITSVAQYGIPAEAMNLINNNEVNGYDNQTHYTPTGSQVSISTKTPFLKVVSPTITYSTDSKFQDTLDAFWKTIEYYGDIKTTSEYSEMSSAAITQLKADNIKVITDYLHNSFNLYDPEFYFENNLTVVNNTEENHITNNLRGTLSPDKAVPFYMRVEEDVTADNISDSFIQYFTNVDGGVFKELVKNNKIKVRESGSGTSEDVAHIILHQNDYIYVTRENNNNFGFKYVPQNETASPNQVDSTDENNQTIILSYAMLTEEEYSQKKFLVDKNGKKIIDVNLKNDLDHLNIASLFIDDFNEQHDVTINGLANMIYNAATQYEKISSDDENYEEATDIGEDDYLIRDMTLTEGNYASNLKVLFLQKADYETFYALMSLLDGGTFGTKKGKELLYVGTDNYYLQTDNYKRGTAQNGYRDGAGLRFDLFNGSLDAYRFRLFAADPSGNYFQMNSNGNPFLQIAYAGSNRNPKFLDTIDLLKISNSEFLLQSQNWYNNSKDMRDCSGTQLDLTNGKLTSYKFDLQTWDSSDKFIGSYIKISSGGEPYFQVHKTEWKNDEDYGIYNDPDSTSQERENAKPIYNMDLIKIARNDFQIKSANYNDKEDLNADPPRAREGIAINLQEGAINAYNFHLKALNTKLWADPLKEGEEGEEGTQGYHIENVTKYIKEIRNILEHANTFYNYWTYGTYHPKDTSVNPEIPAYTEGAGLNWSSIPGDNDFHYEQIYNKIISNENRAARYRGSYIEMNNNGNPYLCIGFKDVGRTIKVFGPEANGETTNGNTPVKYSWISVPAPMSQVSKILVISNDQFVIQSPNFTTSINNIESATNGFKLDVLKGEITATNAKITLQNFVLKKVRLTENGPDGSDGDNNTASNQNSYINHEINPGEIPGDSQHQNQKPTEVVQLHSYGTFSIDGSRRDYVLSVHGEENNKYFRLYWDGSFIATAGVVGGWRINNTSLWSCGTTTDGLPSNKSFLLSVRNFTRNIGPFKYDANETMDADLYLSQSDITNIRKKLKRLRIAIGENFGITDEGSIFAHEGYFSGKIVAKSGNIGGWKITSEALIKENSNGQVTVSLRSNVKSSGELYERYNIYGATIYGAALTGGSINIGNGAFHVESNGNCTASWLSASGGYIGGCKIVAGGLSGGSIEGAAISGGTGSFTGLVTCGGLQIGTAACQLSEQEVIIGRSGESTPSLTLSQDVTVDGVTGKLVTNWSSGSNGITGKKTLHFVGYVTG